MGSNSLQLALAALIGGGVAGAVVVFSAGPSAAVATASAPAAAPAADDALLMRVLALEERNLAFEMQLALLRDTPAPTVREPSPSGAPSGISRAEFDALARKLDALQSSGVAEFAEPEVLEERVAGALTEIRKKESTQKVRSYNEKRRAGLDTAIEKLTEPMELTRGQANDLRRALLAQYDREDEILRMWESGGAEERIAERKASDLELFRGDLGSFLGAQQVEQFWSIARGGK